MNSQPILIAIDGPSASGKGSLAQKLAQYFKIPHLNTGALYRAVAWRILQNKIDPDEIEKNLEIATKNIAQDDLENDELFTEKTGEIASKIARNPLLREKLVQTQKDFIANGTKNHGGAVLDGRDISSKIMPEANFKFYVTANVEIRALRRFKQLREKGGDVSFEEILDQLKKRDESDKNRTNSPLVIDENATIIDNGNLTAKETLDLVLNSIKQS